MNHLLIGLICLLSINLSAQWEPLDSPATIHLNDACFINENLGYVAGGMNGINGVILKTTDGENFIELEIPFYNQLNSVYFIDEDIGYVAGHNGLIAKTIDGGLNWIVQISNTTSQLNSIYFKNEEIGYSSGYGSGFGGEIFMTIDGGQNWTSVFYNSYQMNHMTFVSQSLGYATADYGRIIKTTNGGLSWDMFITEALGNLMCIEFVDEDIGYASSTYGEILKTEDGGQNWTVDDGVSNSNLRYLYCLSEAEVYSCGNEGKILHTIDGGISWELEETYTSKSLQTILFPIPEVGYAFGFDGTILKTITTDKKELKTSNKVNISTFPNPFSDQIIIESNNISNGTYTVKVINAEGKNVYEEDIIVTDNKLIEKINLSSLKMGIYLLEFNSDRSIQVTKIIKTS